MPLVTNEIEFQPGDEILTTEVMGGYYSDEPSPATVSRVYKKTMMIHYGVYTDFAVVDKSSCTFLKRPEVQWLLVQMMLDTSRLTTGWVFIFNVIISPWIWTRHFRTFCEYCQRTRKLWTSWGWKNCAGFALHFPVRYGDTRNKIHWNAFGWRGSDRFSAQWTGLKTSKGFLSRNSDVGGDFDGRDGQNKSFGSISLTLPKCLHDSATVRVQGKISERKIKNKKWWNWNARRNLFFQSESRSRPLDSGRCRQKSFRRVGWWT